MRKPVIAGNWKMHMRVSESLDTVMQLRPLVVGVTHCEIVVCPVFTALKPVADRLEGSNIGVGAQNVAAESKQGAFTGEVSAELIADAGARYAIIGHSERRQYYHETDAFVARKIVCVLEQPITPIVCVGETLAEREAGQAVEVVKTQIRRGLSGLTPSDLTRIIVAYEPVWAIGTGKTATPDIAQTMHWEIREILGEIAGNQIASDIRILYGGSVKSGNISELMAQPDIDGALVGGASLDAGEFARIINYM